MKFQNFFWSLLAHHVVEEKNDTLYKLTLRYHFTLNDMAWSPSWNNRDGDHLEYLQKNYKTIAKIKRSSLGPQ